MVLIAIISPLIVMETLTEAEWSYVYSVVCVELQKYPKNKMIDNILNKIRDSEILK